MKYCSQCGSKVVLIIPEGDNRHRHVCESCSTIHYQNPNIVAGTVPIYEGKVLLCKRAIEPRLGYWTLPAGFMENKESASEAAIRETREEAQAEIHLGSLFTMLSVPEIDQVHIFFLAELKSPEFGAGEETLEARLFSEQEIPWSEIAFPTVKKTLHYYFETAEEDRSKSPTRVEEIRRNPVQK